MTALDTPAICPTCSKPLAGRGKCRSYAHVAIGPRKVGSIVEFSGYGRSVVVAIQPGGDETGWSIVERDLTGDTPGRIRTHFTAWNARREKVIGFDLSLV